MKFCIITPCRNASEYIKNCIQSVLSQTHTDWRMFIIDDMSDDNTCEVAKAAANTDQRVNVIQNNKRKYALKNIIETVRQHAAYDEIIVTLDGDDYLSDPDALLTIADEYAHGADVVWTQHVNQNGETGNSGPLKNDPITASWRMSHLRTFRRGLIDGISERAWLDDDGEYWKCAYDQVLYRGVLKLARKPKFLDRVCMVYNQASNTTNNPRIQIATAKRIQTRLLHEFDYEKRRVLLIVNGPHKDSDKRFHQGERRHPLGVLTLAAALRARQHEVRLIDRFAEPGKWDAMAVKWADTIGVYCSSPNWPDAVSVFEKLRGSGKYIIAGGPHATLHPYDVLEYADAVCCGEGDFEIIRMVESHKKGVSKIERLRKLDETPLPAYALAQESGAKYDMGWPFDNTMPVYPISTSRSCPHACAFCDTRDIWGRLWTAKSPDRVVQDVRYLVESYGAKGIYFREDNFACSKARVYAICDGLEQIGNPVKWACEIRADTADDTALVERMAACGCVGFYIGAESGSDRMLKIFNKGVTSKQLFKACENANRFGIGLMLSVITDHPDETEADKDATELLISLAKPRRVNRCPFRPKEAVSC
ncbi:MAG: glycosyltransferase [Candidatus Marinimicrobia bacterium]|nr:glycosyltransferase [Candidatus Neomarinimicrobiota bacterium]